MTVPTARAMASGSLSANAPLSGVTISLSADVRDTTAGVPHASDSSAASPNVSCGPGASVTSAEASSPATVCRSETKPGEVDRQPGGLSLQPGPQRALAHDDQAGVDAEIAQRGQRVDAAVDALFHRQPAAVHQQELRRCGPLPPHQGGVPARMEGLQVHAQRDGDDVRRADAVEFFARKPGGAHHGVVVGGGAPVGEVGEASRRSDAEALWPARRSRRSWEIITVVAPCSRPHRPSDLSVSRSETSRASGRSASSSALHRSRHHRAVAAGERNQPGGHGDSHDTRGQLAAVGARTRDDQKHVVAGGAVFGAEPVHRGAQAAGARAIEVGDLHNAHTVRTPGARVQSTI